MFDRLIREIKKMEQGVRIPISLPLDGAGYFDRRCPSSECNFEFKILFSDWEAKVSDDHVYCPLCRHDQPSTEWNTEEQSEYIQAAAHSYLQKTINQALHDDARQFNRRQKPGFIQISLSVKPGSMPIMLPIDAASVMEQRLACEICNCHYAVTGAAFFCPACGHNSVVATFTQTIETVRQIVGQMTSVRTLLAANFDEDIAHNSVRTTLEDSVIRLVGAFQQFSEALFEKVPTASTFKKSKNTFQRLAEASALWRNAIGKGYDDLLTIDELRTLGEMFQKRHLLAHRNGIVDQEYIDKSGDVTYAVGQRLVIKEATVLRLAELLNKLSRELYQLI